MRYSDFIRKGDTIGFVAPSFGCATEPYRSAFENAQKKFKRKGFHVLCGPNCYEASGTGISNTPQKCAEELMDFYERKDSDALISCGGGELMCEILPFMDWERIKKADPKWFMGFSDNTNFTFLSAILCDTAAVYGPNAASFGMQPWHPAIKDAFSLLCGQNQTVHNYSKWEIEGLRDEEHPLLPYNPTEKTIIRTYGVKDRAALSGRLIGGCLDSLANLTGTEFDRVEEFADRYSQDGIIWFLEACDLTVMGIRRSLWQLKHAGWFKNVKAFLIGRPYLYGESAFGIDQYSAVTEILGDFQVPILMDLDIGHRPPMMPLVVGASADLEYKKGKLQITYTWK